MPRRPTRNITGIKGPTGKVDYKTVWRVFECGNPHCDYLQKVSEDTEDFKQANVTCPKCNRKNTVDIVHRAARWKYCRVCEWLQPLEHFDRHKPTSTSFRSGRQLECKACKKVINAFLNPKRTRDQHRESSDRRRLYGLLAGEQKINEKEIYERFKRKCFCCNKPLYLSAKSGEKYHLDHTLPARLLWPLCTGPTLLCDEHNNMKHDKWPSEFYKESQLKELSILTGIPYDLLRGTPKLNPDAVTRLLSNVDGFLVRWARYPEEIKKIRNLILKMEGIDIYERAHFVPDFLK